MLALLEQTFGPQEPTYGASTVWFLYRNRIVACCGIYFIFRVLGPLGRCLEQVIDEFCILAVKLWVGLALG